MIFCTFKFRSITASSFIGLNKVNKFPLSDIENTVMSSTNYLTVMGIDIKLCNNIVLYLNKFKVNKF